MPHTHPYKTEIYLERSDMATGFLTVISKPFKTKFILKIVNTVLEDTVPVKNILSSLIQGKCHFQQCQQYKKQEISDFFHFVNLKVFFRIKITLSFKFTFRDEVSKEMCSLFCYKFLCSSCNTIY